MGRAYWKKSVRVEVQQCAWIGPRGNLTLTEAARRPLGRIRGRSVTRKLLLAGETLELVLVQRILCSLLRSQSLGRLGRIVRLVHLDVDAARDPSDSSPAVEANGREVAEDACETGRVSPVQHGRGWWRMRAHRR